MRQVVTLLVLLFTMGTASAQNVAWGKPEVDKKSIYGRKIVCTTQDYVYTLENKDKSINLLIVDIPKPDQLYISAYNTDSLTRNHRNEIKFPKRKDAKFDYQFKKLLEVDDQLILLLSARSRKDQTTHVLAQKINKDGSAAGHFIDIITLEPKRSKDFFSKTIEPDFTVIQSANKQKFAVVSQMAQLKNENKKIAFHLFDKNLNAGISCKVGFQKQRQFFELEQLLLTDHGKFIMLAKEYESLTKVGLSGKEKKEEAKAKRGESNYNFRISSIDPFDKSVKKQQLKLDNDYVTDVHMQLLGCQDSLVIAGYYSEKYGAGIGGVFVHHWDMEQDLFTKVTKQRLKPSFVSLFVNRSRALKLKKDPTKYYELQQFNLSDLVVFDDLSVTLVSERVFIETNTSTITDQYGYSRTTTSFTYNYNEIIAFNINKEGKLRWSARIPKRQISFNDYGPHSSYLLLKEGDDLQFFFNDHKKNMGLSLDVDDPKNLGNVNRANFTQVTLSKDGDMRRKAFLNNEEHDYVIRPKSSWYQGDKITDQLYFFGVDFGYFKKTRYKIGSLKL